MRRRDAILGGRRHRIERRPSTIQIAGRDVTPRRVRVGDFLGVLAPFRARDPQRPLDVVDRFRVQPERRKTRRAVAVRDGDRVDHTARMRGLDAGRVLATEPLDVADRHRYPGRDVVETQPVVRGLRRARSSTWSRW